MKFLLSLLLISSLPAFALVLENKDIRSKSEAEIRELRTHLYRGIEQEQLKAGKPKMDLGASLVLKRKIEEYVSFIARRIDDSSLSFEEFTKDPDKHYRNELVIKHKRLADSPQDTFEYCKKTALKEIICPEGVYSFTGSKVEIQVNDNQRGTLKDTGSSSSRSEKVSGATQE